MATKHWYYPSTIIGCNPKDFYFCAEELTCLRSEVTCPACLDRLREDKMICEACRLGAPEVVPVDQAPPHVCDPALA